MGLITIGHIRIYIYIGIGLIQICIYIYRYGSYTDIYICIYIGIGHIQICRLYSHIQIYKYGYYRYKRYTDI